MNCEQGDTTIYLRGTQKRGHVVPNLALFRKKGATKNNLCVDELREFYLSQPTPLETETVTTNQNHHSFTILQTKTPKKLANM
jgi:UDP:flavonoid glycosyltransferase YjiC (YdhE family)